MISIHSQLESLKNTLKNKFLIPKIDQPTGLKQKDADHNLKKSSLNLETGEKCKRLGSLARWGVTLVR